MMLGFALGQTWQVVFSTATVVCEAIMVFGAIMLNARPTKHFVWGITLLVFSIASFIGWGGFLIGALLGMLGGTLAIITSKNSGVFISPRISPNAN